MASYGVPGLTAIVVLAGLFATTGCGTAGGSSSGQPGSSSQLSPSSTSVSFGKVLVGSPAAESVILTDAGPSNISISALSVSGASFIIKSGSAATLTPNQSITISVSFVPKAIGEAQGTLSVSSDAANPAMNITLTGTGVAQAEPTSQLTANLSGVSFGNETVGTPTVQQIILVDSGAAVVTISAVSATGPGFSVSGGTNSTLNPNGTVPVSVSFDPAAAGAAQGTLSISSNAANPLIQIPLSGTGTAKNLPPSSQLTASSTSVSFGSVAVGAAVTRSVTLTDSGSASVTISAVSARGSGFSASGGSNVTLTPNGSVTISVAFDPTGAATAEGSLSIASNASNSVLNIPLSGTGTTLQHSVALNWQPSASQVSGYFVYRGTSASDVSKLFLSSIKSTSYTDSSVANGQTYLYAVTSVDSNNVESAPSNEISVTIPPQ